MRKRKRVSLTGVFLRLWSFLCQLKLCHRILNNHERRSAAHEDSLIFPHLPRLVCLSFQRTGNSGGRRKHSIRTSVTWTVCSVWDDCSYPQTVLKHKHQLFTCPFADIPGRPLRENVRSSKTSLSPSPCSEMLASGGRVCTSLSSQVASPQHLKSPVVYIFKLSLRHMITCTQRRQTPRPSAPFEHTMELRCMTRFFSMQAPHSRP